MCLQEKVLLSQPFLIMVIVKNMSLLKSDINFIGGFKNALLGAEGMFLANLTGPGLVYLQSLPFSRLADRIIAAYRFQSRGESKGLAGIGGDILGNILQGDR